MATVTNATNHENARARQHHAMTMLILRAIDIVIGVVSIMAGVLAIVATPASVGDELDPGWEWVVFLWATLLIVGGAGLSVGRVIDRWLFQTTGIVAMIPGAGIYFIFLVSAGHANPGALVAGGIILIATLLLLRRYLELQEFTAPSRAGQDDRLADRIRSLLTRR